MRRQTGGFHGDTQNRERDCREAGYQQMLDYFFFGQIKEVGGGYEEG